tara:strand:+ start:328 stop:513 length:186 start_codon:yes stop_codon:yes gene_type:complete
MTYRELLDILASCWDEQLDQEVTICDMDGEFWPAVIQTVDEKVDDVLDAGHLYLDATWGME